MRNQVVDETNPGAIAVPRGAAAVESQDLEPAAIESSPAAAMPDEIPYLQRGGAALEDLGADTGAVDARRIDSVHPVATERTLVGCTILATPAATMAAATNREAAMTSKSRSKGVYFRDGVAYIRYRDERGQDVQESPSNALSKWRWISSRSARPKSRCTCTSRHARSTASPSRSSLRTGGRRTAPRRAVSSTTCIRACSNTSPVNARET
jgi:hypothetical protein